MSMKARASSMGAHAVRAACMVMLAWCLALAAPCPAWAYFSKPAPTISMAGSTSMVSGSSQAVTCAVSPISEQQLPGCGMAECPQGCDDLTNPSTGVQGGCLSSDGWCTCAGTSYSTVYTTVSVSSSDPSVARASWSGGVLNVSAYRAGTATLTVNASLPKHASASASMTVTVSEPAPSTPSAPPSGGTTSGGGSSGGGSGAGGTVSVTAAGSSVTAAAAQAAGETQEVVELEAEDGTKIIVVEATDAATAASKLQEVAGTAGTCTFWSGGTLDSPSVSWTFKGEDLDPAADLSFDPAVSVSKRGTGGVAELLADVKNAIVLDFAHSGALPATAEMYVRASGVYEDGHKASLYLYDEETGTFSLVKEDIEVTDGYLVFSMDHCSTWALSDEDLAALEPVAADAADASAQDAEGVDATAVDVKAADGTPYVVAAVAAVLVAVVATVALLVRRRRRARTAVAPGEDVGADGAAGDAAGGDAPEADGAAGGAPDAS